MHIRLIALAFPLCFALLPPAALAQDPSEATVEENVDRYGSDYHNFTMRLPDYRYCQSACVADRACVAWTFVREGVQGPAARCWLKNQVPATRASDCCTSGIVR